MAKVFVLGVDGGSFQLINSFVEQGYLPVFQKMIEGGAYGRFVSTVPPHTAPGWTSIMTGVHTGTHGVYQFWKTNGEDYIGGFQGSEDWRSPSLWEILNAYNLKTAVVNVPMTHPPKKLNGFMISWPLSKTLNYSYPRTLLKEVMDAGCRWYPDLYLMYTGQQDYLQKALDITRDRVKTLQYFIQNKEWDLCMAVFPEVDRISHFYWNYMDAGSPYYKEDASLKYAILDIYREVDRAMGKIVELLPKDTLFVSMSDHGFRRGTINFNIDSFLVEKGYMVLNKTDVVVQEQQSGYENNFNWFMTQDHGQGYEVDWGRTKFYIAAPGSYGVNFNLLGRQREGVVRENEKEKLFHQLKKDLLALRHPHKDIPLFVDVVLGEEIYKGKASEYAPDIMLIPYDYGVMVDHHLKPGEIFSEPEQKGMHCRDGYILFYGEGISKGKRIEYSEVTDFLPTLLVYLGIDIPEYIEGKEIDVIETEYRKNIVMRHRIDVAKEPKSAQRSESYSEEERAEIEQRLKGMGYL